MNDMRMVDNLTDEDIVLDDNGQHCPGAVVALHNSIIKALRKTYPAFADHFHITINTEGGTVQIRNLLLSGDYGVQLKITSIDSEMRLVREKVGEMFERFNVLRGRALSIQSAMRDVQRNGIGKLKHED
jgi:hypothetical protein